MLFIMTGFGKGCFNIFAGLMLFFQAERGKITDPNNIIGGVMTIVGVIFIVVSKMKDMDGDDIDRTASL